MQFIKQLRDNFISEQSNRNNFSSIDRKKLFQKYNNKCAICKCITDEFEIDHIKPLASNGTNHIDNLQPLCKSCHKQKTKQEREDGYVRIIDTESSYNNEVKNIMQDPLSFSYAFIEPLNKKIYKKLSNYHIDINKCRKNILYYSEDDYPVFTVMDSPVIYNKDKHNFCLLYTSPSPRDRQKSRMPSSA